MMAWVSTHNGGCNGGCDTRSSGDNRDTGKEEETEKKEEGEEEERSEQPDLDEDENVGGNRESVIDSECR